MSTLLSRGKQHVLNWRQWELNPIVVKELRQAVRSWTVTGMLFLFLSVLFLTALAVLVGNTFDNDQNRELGGITFQAFVTVLALTSVIFIPLYAGIRVAAERVESNLDLLYVSTLSPGQIIRGKFYCAVYMTVLFFSACMPFMAFTNLLRGIDLPTIFAELALLFTFVCVASLVAIFMACLPISRPLKIILGLVTIVSLLPTVVAMIFSFFSMSRSGMSGIGSGTNFWAGVASTGSLVVAGMILLYLLATALISPPSANRAPPVRIYLTGVWLLSLVLAVGWAWYEKDAENIMNWATMTIFIMGGALVVVISGPDELSDRVRRAIPESGLKRLLAFFFFSGAGGGIAWVAGLSLATLGITAACLHLAPGAYLKRITYDEQQDFIVKSAAVIGYIFDYTLLALLVQRRFLKRRSPRFAGVFLVLIPALWALLLNIVSFFLNRLSFDSMQRLQVGNIFNVFISGNTAGEFYHLVFALCWLILMVALSWRWFRARVRGFKRPGEQQPPPLPV